MSDLQPSRDSISREALERIIHRAAELQAAERDIGDSLTEDEVRQLGRDVGLPGRYVQQALLEERNRVAPAVGLLQRMMGATYIQVGRTVPGEAADVSAVLEHWMTDRELLVVKRRYPDRTSWEPQTGFWPGLRRGLGIGGHRYVLSRAREVVTQVEPLEDGWCHVTLRGDLTNSRNEFAAGAAAAALTGGTSAVVALVMGVMAPVAALPAGLGLAVGTVVLRSRRGVVERIQVALEQILDRLERGEIKPPAPPPRSQGLFPKAIVDEVRKHLGPWTGSSDDTERKTR